MDDTDFLRYVPKCYKCGEIIRPSGSPLDVAVARTNGRELMRTCEQGCNGCEECVHWDDDEERDEEPREAPEFGCCLPPGECCMPGLHFPSECHTAADYERRGR